MTESGRGVGEGRLSFRDRVGNPLDWSTTDKVALSSVTALAFFLIVHFWASDAVRRETARTFVDHEWLEELLGLRYLVIGIWLAVIAAALFLRRRSPDSRWLLHLQSQFYALSFSIAGVLIGTFTLPVGIVYFGVPLFACILFDARAVLPALVTSTLILAGATVAALEGRIPYAPLFLHQPYVDGRPVTWWAVSLAIFSIPPMLMAGAMGLLILRRWHEREEEVERLACTDSLTGIANRRHLLERLQEEFERARRYQHPLSLVMVDLDYFKRVNDTHGHLVGDDVLAAAAAALRRCVRATDLIGRFGGEEFCLLLPETDAEGAREVAERCRRAVCETIIPCSRSGGIRVSASLGLACRTPGPDDSVDALLQRADDALYQAKDAGRNRVVG